MAVGIIITIEFFWQSLTLTEPCASLKDPSGRQEPIRRQIIVIVAQAHEKKTQAMFFQEERTQKYDSPIRTEMHLWAEFL